MTYYSVCGYCNTHLILLPLCGGAANAGNICYRCYVGATS